MITANGAEILVKARICKQTIQADTLTDINGEANTQIILESSVDYTSYGASSNKGGVRLVYGGGDTAESAGDTALADPLGVFNVNGSANYSAGKYVVTATAVNSAGAAITVKEIGLLFEMIASFGQSFLAVRQLVPPRVVEHGETFTYSMAINFKGAE